MKNKTLFSEIWHVAGTDELRPDLSQVYILEGFAYCTNATIGIRQSLELWDLQPGEADILNGKAIPAESLKKASRDKIIIFEPDQFRTDSGQVFSYCTDINETFRKNFIGIVNGLFKIYAGELKPVNVWAFNPATLAKMAKALQPADSQYITAFYKASDKPLICIDNIRQDLTENAGFIFPVVMKEEFNDPAAWGGILPGLPESEPENEPGNENE